MNNDIYHLICSILQKGLQLGSRTVPGDVFSGMVVVSVVTCLVTPLIVHLLLARGWQNREDSA